MITPTRNEIDDAFKWAVNDIYESDEAWEKDLLYILEDSKTKSEFQSRLKDSSDNLFNAFKEIDDKVYYFSTDNTTLGKMLTGFIDIEGEKYLFDEDGAMIKGWKEYDGKTYSRNV